MADPAPAPATATSPPDRAGMAGPSHDAGTAEPSHGTGMAQPPAPATAAPLLHVSGLRAGYGNVGVLHGIDLAVAPGEVLAVLGPNGAGKTTLLRALSGLLPRTGAVRFDGRDMAGAGPREAAAAGLVHVIEGHRVFTGLSVHDNLLLAAYDLPRRERAARVEEALDTFPEIAAKRAERGGALSGGQQQMLAVAQGLVRRPRLLMLDEPSAGLSPGAGGPRAGGAGPPARRRHRRDPGGAAGGQGGGGGGPGGGAGPRPRGAGGREPRARPAPPPGGGLHGWKRRRRQRRRWRPRKRQHGRRRCRAGSAGGGA